MHRGTRIFFAILTCVPTVPAVEAVQPQPAQVQAGASLTSDQLDQMLGAIALYPDPLIAQVLPAATYPTEIVKAARKVRAGETGDQLDREDWDPSVKAVAHYPDVIQLMDDNLEWTEQLGQAFIAQPDEVMASIQRLRLKAQTLGNLATTPQQQVVLEDSTVRILPADPQVVYVPVYEPSVVYYEPPPTYGSYVTFGLGLPLGLWLDLDADWGHHWFYRPGWTWNHWHDNVFIDRGRVSRVRRNFDFRGGERPDAVWHRDAARPWNRATPSNRGEFDRFRGRDRVAAPSSSVPVPATRAPDRGRRSVGQSPGVFDPARATSTPRPVPVQRSSPTPPRTTAPPSAVVPTAPRTAAVPTAPGSAAVPTAPRTAAPAVPPRATTTPAAPSRTVAPPTRTVTPARPVAPARPVTPAPRPAPVHVSPAPVHISPPPARSSAPSYSGPRRKDHGG